MISFSIIEIRLLTSEQELRNIAASTRDHATNQAMQMPPNNRPPKPTNVQLIIAILPFPATDIRRAIKRFGDVEEGIPTQCVASTFGIGMSTSD